MTTINQFKPDIAFHPGETLAEKLQELNMGIKEFSIRTEKPEKTIIAVIKGESSLTPEMAVLFENVLKIPADFWLKKQYRFDEYKAREKRALAIENAKNWAKSFPTADMIKNKWINNISNAEEKVLALFNFFGVSSPVAWENYFFNQQLKVAFRISLAHTKEPYAVSAWIRQGEIQANELVCGEYSENKFKDCLNEIKSIMATQPDDFFEQLQRICLVCGVKVVFTPCIKKAPLSGATRWIGTNPVIQLTGRYKQNDCFWFTFFHEAGHILLHGKKDIFLEDIEYSEADKQKEEEADAFAIEWTFSLEEEKEFLKTYSINSINDTNVKQFAKKINTHPAMIIGRFHKNKTLHYAQGRIFFVKLDFSKK